MKRYLTSISLPANWKAPDNGVIEFYEVLASNEEDAKCIAVKNFKRDFQYVPWIKKYMAQFGLVGPAQTVADAVEL